MTIRHHFPDDVLLSYAAGELDDAMSLIVATHLTLCPACRKVAACADEIGGVMLEELPPTTMSPDALARVLARTEQTVDAADTPATDTTAPGFVLPGPLRQRLGGDLDNVRWKHIGPGVKQYVIARRDNGAQARLVKMASGRKAMTHGHAGEEYTMVVSGAFSDAGMAFTRGDVEIAGTDVVHSPIADDNGGCVCLVVMTGRLKFRNVLGRIAQPFIGI